MSLAAQNLKGLAMIHGVHGASSSKTICGHLTVLTDQSQAYSTSRTVWLAGDAVLFPPPTAAIPVCRRCMAHFHVCHDCILANPALHPKWSIA